jgi:hypothetical protein
MPLRRWVVRLEDEWVWLLLAVLTFRILPAERRHIQCADIILGVSPLA